MTTSFGTCCIPEAPDSFLANTKADPQWEWARAPEVREAVRPQVAELARVATFLATEGIALNASAHALLVDAVQDNLMPAIVVLERRARVTILATRARFPVVHRRTYAQRWAKLLGTV